MADEPRITLLVDADDDARTTAGLLAAHDPAVGRIVVHPTAGSRSASGLAQDVLLALGHPIRRLARERISTAAPAFKAATAWIVGDVVTDLIVLRAHLLSPEGWAHLIEMTRCTGAQLILVQHTRTLRGELQRLLDDVAHQVTKDTAAVAGERSVAAPPEPDGPGEPLPRLPTSDVHRFRADAYRTLSPADFARVDRVYSHGLDAACKWLAQHPDRPRGETLAGTHQVFPPFMSPSEVAAGVALLENRFKQHALHDLVRGLLCLGREWGYERHFPQRFSDHDGLMLFLSGLAVDSPSRDHTVARLRGAQAGFLLHGLHLALPADLRGVHGPGMNTTVVTTETGARLRAAVAHPVHAAALVTALFTGLDTTILAAVTTDTLDTDAAVLRTPLQHGIASVHAYPAVFRVPPVARPLLRAARAFQHLHTGRQLLSAGVGHNGRILVETAEAAGLPMPVVTPLAGEPWITATKCWWVSTPLHAKNGPPP